jgi:hypothetical protein
LASAGQRQAQQSALAEVYLYSHDRPEEWFVSLTKAFLKHLQKERLA